MLRVLFLAGAVFLTVDLTLDYASAQTPSPTQCQQVREAVAHYGYAAARQHALAEYGAEAVRAGDQCLGGHARGNHQTNYRGNYRAHHQAHYRKHYKTHSSS